MSTNAADARYFGQPMTAVIRELNERLTQLETDSRVDMLTILCMMTSAQLSYLLFNSNLSDTLRSLVEKVLLERNS